MHLNTLEEFEFDGVIFRIQSRFGHYEIDAGNLEQEEFKAIEQALDRQNYDARFQIRFT